MLFFTFPSPPARVFSPFHQPPLALLAHSHALRFVLVPRKPQEKTVEEADGTQRLNQSFVIIGGSFLRFCHQFSLKLGLIAKH